eukprot:765260-Hanusia_phi.AAC.13
MHEWRRKEGSMRERWAWRQVVGMERVAVVGRVLQEAQSKGHAKRGSGKAREARRLMSECGDEGFGKVSDCEDGDGALS